MARSSTATASTCSKGPWRLRRAFRREPPRLFLAIEVVRDGDALAGSATHLCTPDTYDSSYRFLADGSFVIRHTVHGPRKDYLSATVFRRHAG